MPTSDETRKKISAAKKGKPQTPQHTAAVVAAKAAKKATMTPVSKNDAAAIEIMRQLLTIITTIEKILNGDIKAETNDEYSRMCARRDDLFDIAKAWADGGDVIELKLAQTPRPPKTLLANKAQIFQQMNIVTTQYNAVINQQARARSANQPPKTTP